MLNLFKKNEVRRITIYEALQMLAVKQDLRNILSAYDLSISDIKNIQHKLELCGAGKYVNCKDVSIKSLTDPLTLEFIARNYRKGRFSLEGLDEYDSTIFIIDYLTYYFRRN